MNLEDLYATYSQVRKNQETPRQRLKILLYSYMNHSHVIIREISGDVIFIDGTKIEACANKYTFVWKKTITKSLEKLLVKLADLVTECEELFGIKLIYQNQVKMKHIKNFSKNFML